MDRGVFRANLWKKIAVAGWMATNFATPALGAENDAKELRAELDAIR